MTKNQHRYGFWEFLGEHFYIVALTILGLCG